MKDNILARQLTPEQIAIKGAVKRQVAAIGGLAAAAGFTRVSKSALERYYQPRDPEYHIPLDVAMDLDEAAGNDVILRTWAGLRGIEMIDRKEIAPSASFPMHLSAFGMGVGKTFDCLGEALRDGKVTPREAHDILNSACDLENQLIAVKKDCACVIADAAHD